jgi:glycopeptide antibiotics resistance protein
VLRRSGRVAGALLAIYLLGLLLVLFSPSSTRQAAAVVWLGHVLSHLGAPDRFVVFSRLEIVLNIAIIAPVTFLATFVRPSYSWRDWTAFGFCLACAVELLQGLLLPGRQASFSDVVANALGALLGALVGAALRGSLGRRGSGTRMRHR